jgi:hypothetical protein
MNWLVFLVLAVVVVPILLKGGVHEALRARRRRAQARASAAAFQTRWQAENPDTSPFTAEEARDLQAWYASLILPAVELRPAPDRAVGPNGTRLGGPVWLPEGEAWPTDAEGRPLEFVAQVDFADLPSLPDFPDRGLVQVFVGRDDLYGADLDEPSNGAARALWRPEGVGAGVLTPPPPLDEEGEYSPFWRSEARSQGLPLAGARIDSRPDPSDWRFDVRLAGQYRRAGVDEVLPRWGADDPPEPVRHTVGGHPVFTQYDFRKPGRYDDFDRVLLHLTSDDHLIWGDVGEAAFLIRRDDLLAKRFERTAFYWDCT